MSLAADFEALVDDFQQIFVLQGRRHALLVGQLLVDYSEWGGGGEVLGG